MRAPGLAASCLEAAIGLRIGYSQSCDPAAASHRSDLGIRHGARLPPAAPRAGRGRWTAGSHALRRRPVLPSASLMLPALHEAAARN